MRTFLAICFTQEEKNEFYTIQQSLCQEKCGGKSVDKDQLHMTLAFLGEVTEDQLALVQRILQKINAHGFVLDFDKIEMFSHGSEYLYYAAPSNDCRIRELAEYIRKALTYKKIFFDSKAFVPHVTLIRHANKAMRVWENFSVRVRVDSLHLVKSETAEGHAVYTILDTKELGRA